MMSSTTFSRSWGKTKGMHWSVISTLLLLLGSAILAGCVADGTTPPLAVNSYCAVYQRVIRSEEEGASLHHTHRTVKERIAANDTLFRCECEGWDNPVCRH